MDLNCFILFHTIHDVLKAEKVLKKQGIVHELVPVPRNLSSDCGMCIKTDQDEARKIMSLFSGMEAGKCFVREGDDYICIS